MLVRNPSILVVLPALIAALAAVLGKMRLRTGMTLTLLLAIAFLGLANEAAISIWGGGGTDYLARIMFVAVGSFVLTTVLMRFPKFVGLWILITTLILFNPLIGGDENARVTDLARRYAESPGAIVLIASFCLIPATILNGFLSRR